MFLQQYEEEMEQMDEEEDRLKQQLQQAQAKLQLVFFPPSWVSRLNFDWSKGIATMLVMNFKF